MSLTSLKSNMGSEDHMHLIWIYSRVLTVRLGMCRYPRAVVNNNASYGYAIPEMGVWPSISAMPNATVCPPYCTSRAYFAGIHSEAGP